MNHYKATKRKNYVYIYKLINLRNITWAKETKNKIIYTLRFCLYKV